MNFEQLLALVGDNVEAQTFIKGVQETQETNVQTINKNESLINNLKGDLEKFKQGNSLVKSKLGLEQLNEESLSEALSKYSKSKDDVVSKAEYENIKAELEKINGKYQEDTSKFNSTIQELKLGTQLQDLIAGTSILPEARQDALQIVKSMMKFNENNEPVFLNEDGTTKYHNGKPFGLADAVSSLQETRPYMFSRDTKSGGGTQPNNGSATTGKLGGTPEEERAYIQAKYGNKN